MSHAYICDHCGEFVKGEPPREPVMVGEKDESIWLSVQVWQHPETEKKFRPELCRGCVITAVQAVADDLRKGLGDGQTPDTTPVD